MAFIAEELAFFGKHQIFTRAYSIVIVNAQNLQVRGPPPIRAPLDVG
jgi:hypothetical protein